MKSSLQRIFLALLLACACHHASAANRGLSLVTEDSNGQAIQLYEGSHALLIGATRYENSQWPDLESIPKELDLVATVLKQQGFIVEKHFDPDNRELENLFRDFIDRYGYEKENRLLFYFAGHGYTRDNGNKGYLVPVDAPSPLEDEKGFQRKALPMSQILAWARESEAKHSLFLFDSCFSGTIFKSRALPDRPPVINKLVSLPVRQFITAGSAGETVPAHSTFTPAFVDAIQYGRGDLNRDGYVSGTELGLYLQQEVPRYVSQTPQFGKIQEYELSRGDFIFALAASAQQVSSDRAEDIQSESKTAAGGSVGASNKAALQDNLEIEFWKTIKDSNNAALYRAYLNQFPGGTYAEIAKVMIMESGQSQTSSNSAALATSQEKSQTTAPEDDPLSKLISGVWVDNRGCHLFVKPDSQGKLMGAAWGKYGGSMIMELEPEVGSDRVFFWKGRRMTMFDPELTDPRKEGKLVVNLYDNRILHPTTGAVCSRNRSEKATLELKKKNLETGASTVKPPQWFAERFQSLE